MNIKFNSIKSSLLIAFSAIAVVLISVAAADIIYFKNSGDDEGFRVVIISLIIVGLLLLTTSAFLIIRKLSASVKKVKNQISILSAGNLPTAITSKDELKVVMDEINVLTVHLRNVKDFALEVGKGNFDSNIQVFNNKGEIGQSLAEMRESLKMVAEEGRQRNWANEGYSLFNEVLRKNGHDLDLLAVAIITNLVKYVKANQGGLFILNENHSEGPTLELRGCYAYDRRKFLKKDIKPGEGLAGQCFLEKESIFMTEVPDNHVTITSGLGKANPRCIFIVPVKLNDEVFGIIELASFAVFTREEREFIEKLSESIAASISSVKTNHTTRLLLQDSQALTERLKIQEDEMKQNMEELHATQEEMRRVSEELNLRLEVLENSLPVAEITTEGIFIKANHKFLQITGYSENELWSKDLFSIIQKDEQKVISDIKLALLSKGKKEDEIKIINRSGECCKIRFYLNPVLNFHAELKSYIFICYEVGASQDHLLASPLVNEEELHSLIEDEKDLLWRLQQNNIKLKTVIRDEEL